MPTDKENPQTLQEGFGFTEREDLFNRVNGERFRALVLDAQTVVHQIQIAGNNYGEFLFLTASRPTVKGRECITFWGWGFHEYRERWLTDEWFWHRSNVFPETMSQELSKEEAEELIQQRQEEVASYATDDKQSERGKLFEMLADLTDEDGAYSEMQDLDELFEDL